MASEDLPSEETNETKTETKSESKNARLFTRDEVEKDKKDVWIIIHNKVYDVTAFLGQHPGGEEALIEQAGKDATEPFEDIGHSSDARELMEQYYIGDLVPKDRLDTKEKGNWSWSNEGADDESSSGSWRSWLIPVVLGVLATLVYRYFINAH